MSAVVTSNEEQLCPRASLRISARDKVYASERAEASAGTYFNVSEATSNGGEAERWKQCHSAFGMPELASEIFVVHSGLPMDPIVTLQDVNAVDRRHDVPIKNCALMWYSKRQKVVTGKAADGAWEYFQALKRAHLL